jgi:tetratricopeptide (TPR) repeat protein
MALAQFYVSVGEAKNAEAALQEAVKLDPTAVEPKLFLAQVAVAAGDGPTAEARYLELKKSAPNDPKAYRALAMFYVSTGQKEKAISELRSLLAAKPADATVKGSLCEVLLDVNRTAEASPLVDELLRANADDPQANRARGRILLAGGRSEDAAAAFEKAARADPGSAQTHYLLGLAQRALKRTDAAKASFSRAIQLNPALADATTALAELSLRSGDYAQAREMSESALKSKPSAAALTVKAQSLLNEGQRSQAAALLDHAVRLDELYLPSVAAFVNLALLEGRGSEAVKRMAEMVERHPQNSGLLILQGVAYLGVKDYQRAEASASRALSLDPKAPNAYTVLANAALARGNGEQGKAYLRKAIEARPGMAANYLALVAQYEREANWAEAKRVCEKAHQADPNSPIVAGALAHLYLERGGDVNLAVSLAQMVKQKMPNSPVASDTLGWAYYKLGSYNSAIVHLREAAQKEPGNALYHYHLGMAHLGAKEFGQAKAALRKALQTDPRFPYAADVRAALGRIPAGEG